MSRRRYYMTLVELYDRALTGRRDRTGIEYDRAAAAPHR